MADSVVTIRSGPAALGRAMQRTLENVQRAMQRSAVETARWGVARMVRETAGRKVDASGQFKRQWKVVKFPGGAATANTSPYAAFVERGRGPGHMPPVKALSAWLVKKGIKPKKAPTVSRREALRALSKTHRVTGDVSSARNRKRIRANIRQYVKIYRSKPARTLRHAEVVAGIALAMARKIAKKGTKAKWLLRDVLDDFRREAQKNYLAAVKRVARDPLGKLRRA